LDEFSRKVVGMYSAYLQGKEFRAPITLGLCLIIRMVTNLIITASWLFVAGLFTQEF